MTPDPRDLADKWLKSPGAQAGMVTCARLRKDEVHELMSLAAEAVALEFLTGWLTAWCEGEDIKALRRRVFMEAIQITVRIEGME